MQGLRVFSSIQQPFIFAQYRSKYKGIDPETQLDNGNSNQNAEVNENLTPATTVITLGINAKF
jgi:hypothetical protein